MRPISSSRQSASTVHSEVEACRPAAIIVCFHPDHQKLWRLIAAIVPSVSRIIVVDNEGLNIASLPETSVELKVVSQGANIGVAAALNLGCQVAVELGERYAITFDQDSLPEPGMIEVLMNELLRFQESRASPIAAIGPQIVDVRDGMAIRSESARSDMGIASSGEADKAQPVELLITSGCLLDLKAWRHVPFDARLFIDSVDFNWCWRLAKEGYLCLRVNTARLQHELADGLIYWRWITLTRHGPTRRYYQCRNALYQLLYVPIPWSGRCFLMRDLLRSIIAAVWVDQAKAQATCLCLRGCMHGVLGRLGPLQ